MRRFLSLCACLSLSACSDAYISGPGGGGTDPAADEHPEFDGASLVVHEPVSASILLVDDPVALRAEILDREGNAMDFDEIAWTSDQVGDEAIFVGSDGDADLDWGIHAITATADLPNGDRLQYTVGGVRIQGEHTGVWAGNMNFTVHAEFQGTPIDAACLGGLDFVVDMSGEVLGGSGRCTINLLILGSFDVDYDVDGDVDDDTAEGEVSMDLSFIPVTAGWDGEFDDNDLTGGFEGDAILFSYEGTLEAHRVSLYVDP